MKVKVFSTQMGEKELETNATTWGALQSDLKKKGISFSKMKAVIGETKLTLEADGAMLPVAGFTLFLMNKKTKAGQDDVNLMSYKELRGTIKILVNSDDKGKAFFNEGKNYTTKGTEVLRGLLASFRGEKLVPVETKTKKKAKKSKEAVKGKTYKGVKTPESVMKPVDEPLKKANPVIESAKEAISDVVEPVKGSKVEEFHIEDTKVEEPVHYGLNALGDAIQTLESVTISDLDRELHEDVESLTKRLAKRYNKANKIWKAKVEEGKELQRKEKAKAEKEAKAKAENEAKVAQEIEEARIKEEAEAKIAKEKSDAEALVAEEKAAHDKEMRDQMSDLMGEFGDVS
jgi:hypothetical protein